MKVLIPQDIVAEGKDYLREKGYEVIVGSGHDAETIKREIADCDAVLARTAKYSKEIIAAGKNLKVIARFGVGTDNIDLPFAEEQGVWVTIARGENSNSVAEHTATLIMAASKHLLFLDQQTRAGVWEARNQVPTTELRGKTLGLIGLGDIGRKVAAICHDGLGMKIIGFDAYPPATLPDYIQMADSTDDIFKQSDVISLHIPATKETINMVDKRTLSLMKPNAILVNCARGGIVNEDDLYDALQNKTIAFAAMDVFVEEPALKSLKLWELENFIASPHNAALTKEANIKTALSCARAIDDVLSGRTPEHPVNNPKK